MISRFKPKLVIHFLWSALGIASASMVLAAQPLTLDGYLQQVKEKNLGVKGAEQASEAGELRSAEADLLTAFTIFGNGQYMNSTNRDPNSIGNYTAIRQSAYSLGVSKLFDFGLQARLSYNVNQTFYDGLQYFQLGGTTFAFPPQQFIRAYPLLELTQSLWSNGFGRTTQANMEAQRAQALASGYANRFAVRSAVMQAEMTYWRLALARQTTGVAKEAVDRARKIYDWNARRTKLQLADQADTYQAEALYQTRELDLQSAQNEERSAARAFNEARNIESEEVPEELPPLSPATIDQIQVPKHSGHRDDILAAEQQERATLASARIALERDNPTLEAFASLSLPNKQSSNPLITQSFGDGISGSFDPSQNTATVGLRFSYPLGMENLTKARKGWELEHQAAENNYQRKVFEEERDWVDLNRRLEDSRKHLDLSRRVEQTQAAKLDRERYRLRQGRTTTFQVLQFEQDFLLAQLARIRDQATVLNIIAQMKVYGEKS